MYNYNWEDSLDRESVNQYLTPREVMDLLYIRSEEHTSELQSP